MRAFGLAYLVLAMIAGLARADAEKTGVVATGEASLKREVSGHITTWLRGQGHAVKASPLSPDAIDTIMNCFTLDDLTCARGVFEARAKAGRMVFARVDVAGQNITFNVYWFVAGREPIAERRTCEQCDAAAWHATLDGMLGRLTGDDERRPQLTPMPGGTEEPGSRWVAGGLLAAGIATIATGGVFLFYGSADGADRKYIYPDSTPVGIVLCAVGAGATIGGTILLIQAGSRGSGPVATAGPGGAYLGWAGHF
jgi:hypothetical protein